MSSPAAIRPKSESFEDAVFWLKTNGWITNKERKRLKITFNKSASLLTPQQLAMYKNEILEAGSRATATLSDIKKDYAKDSARLGVGRKAEYISRLDSVYVGYYYRLRLIRAYLALYCELPHLMVWLMSDMEDDIEEKFDRVRAEFIIDGLTDIFPPKSKLICAIIQRGSLEEYKRILSSHRDVQADLARAYLKYHRTLKWAQDKIPVYEMSRLSQKLEAVLQHQSPPNNDELIALLKQVHKLLQDLKKMPSPAKIMPEWKTWPSIKETLHVDYCDVFVKMQKLIDNFSDRPEVVRSQIFRRYNWPCLFGPRVSLRPEDAPIDLLSNKSASSSRPKPISSLSKTAFRRIARIFEQSQNRLQYRRKITEMRDSLKPLDEAQNAIAIWGGTPESSQTVNQSRLLSLHQ